MKGFVFENSPFNSGGNVDLYGHHLEISANEVRNGQDQGIYSAEESHHAQILGNWIHDNGEGVIHQSHGIYLQGNDHLVANNAIHDHVEGFGIQVYDRNSRSILVANTVTGAGHSGIVIGGSGGVDNIRVINNVFAFNSQWGVSHDSTCPTASRADHNVVFGNGSGSLQPGCSGLDYSGGNRTTDPMFVNYSTRNLRVQSGSPAIDYALITFAPFSRLRRNDQAAGRRRGLRRVRVLGCAATATAATTTAAAAATSASARPAASAATSSSATSSAATATATSASPAAGLPDAADSRAAGLLHRGRDLGHAGNVHRSLRLRRHSRLAG